MTGKILFLSDMHVGSIWGLWPRNFKTEDPKTGDMMQYVINDTQRKLWKHWLSMIQYAHDVDCIVFNGDLIDGPQPKSLGKGTVTPDLRIQCAAAVEMIGMLPKVPMYFTQGTGYHSMEDRPVEQYIAEQFDSEYGDDLLIEECGIRMHVSHSISTSTSSWQYWTTAIARDLLLLALHSAEEKYGKVDVAIRSHRHNFCGAIFKNQIGIVTPCWQTRTPYAVKKDLVSPPDNGYVMLRVEDRRNIMIDRSGIIATVSKPCKVVGRDGAKKKNEKDREGLPS